MVFAGPRSQALLALTERVAPSDANILVIGETGTGKELDRAGTCIRAAGVQPCPLPPLTAARFLRICSRVNYSVTKKGRSAVRLMPRKGWF